MRNYDNKRRWIGRVIASSAPLIGWMLLAASQQARALELQINGGAPFVCAGVQGANIANGTPVIATGCTGDFSETWTYKNGTFEALGTTANTQMCLDVKGNGVLPGTLVDLWPCNGGNNQQWVIAEAADGGAEITSSSSGLCLDSSGGPVVTGGTQLIINNCGSVGSQNWILRRAMFELNTAAPHVCIDVYNGNPANGTPVIAVSCSGSFEDEWNYANGLLFGIGTDNATGKCLSASGGGAGSLIVLDACPYASPTRPLQKWTILNGDVFGFASSTVITLGKGLCLDSSGGPPVGIGTQMVLNKCNGTSSQNWIVQ